MLLCRYRCLIINLNKAFVLKPINKVAQQRDLVSLNKQQSEVLFYRYLLFIQAPISFSQEIHFKYINNTKKKGSRYSSHVLNKTS